MIESARNIFEHLLVGFILDSLAADVHLNLLHE